MENPYGESLWRIPVENPYCSCRLLNTCSAAGCSRVRGLHRGAVQGERIKELLTAAVGILHRDCSCTLTPGAPQYHMMYVERIKERVLAAAEVANWRLVTLAVDEFCH